LLPSLLVDGAGNVNPAVARAALSLRAALAPDIAAHAAERGGAKLADALDAVLARMRAAGAEVAALQELALEYWRLLVESGGNIAFRLAFNSMNKGYRQVWGRLTQVMEAEFRDFDNLAELALAVRKRDKKQARACAEKHVAIGTRALEQVLGRIKAK
jgi:DNA-binding FadR family transcriptional regulator